MKLIIVLFVCFLSSNVMALEKLRVGVLAFGTVNWELSIMSLNNIASKNGVDLEIKKLPSKHAVAVALNAGAVDVIVSDFIWVSRQRASGFDYTFYPYSKATGGIFVRPELNLNSIVELNGKNLGIAGGPVNQTWLIARAYTQHKYKKDLKKLITPTFAAPPIINKKMLDKSLDSSINFWHFNAKLKAKNMQKLVGIEEMLSELGIKYEVPLIGWVFSEKFAKNNTNLINGFLQSSYETKKLLDTHDIKWNTIRSLMKAKDDNTFKALKDGYLEGIPRHFGDDEKSSAKQLFKVLAKEGGAKLVGKSKVLQEGTFWNFNPDIQW